MAIFKHLECAYLCNDHMAFKLAVVDLDGCIIDEVSSRFDSKLGEHKGALNSSFREMAFVSLHALPHSRKFYASLLREEALDEEIVKAMKQLQDEGTELHIVTKHKGLDKAWLSDMLGRHGIAIGANSIHVVNGDKSSTINGLKADLVIDDQPDSVLNIDGNAKILLLRRSYNKVSMAVIKLLRGSKVSIVDPSEIASVLGTKQ